MTAPQRWQQACLPGLEPLATARLSELPLLLAQRYRVERLLGAGAMGVVYRARDLLHEQFGDPAPWVALKLLNPDFVDITDASALLYSEFVLMRRLCHPCVVRAYSFEVDNTCARTFMTQELIEGRSLDRLLCERPEGLPWPALQPIAMGLLEALAHAHQRGVLHGDVKPGNVLLAEEGPRLFDFGLGRPMAGVLPGLAQLNRSRFKAWTPAYAAAELMEGAPLSVATDIYALGCVLYELASGIHPFQRLDALKAREQGLVRTLRRPAQLPRPLWPALRQALSFDPEQRNINADQLLEAFRKVEFQRRWPRFWHRS
ncbi:serine/threonine protein kinase [Pseudomonas gingeri]|uniref:Serine/threonine protein kinase n=1 Tax=Pseudomonas gingeri TaxID=117681 RepID=A0A7Y8C210_9PSED|nr:serine/threonine-protein kinase [Pseudomonas gingeri]NWB97080.1 serine/threonine protein kinase [Pseudomonas gingeri]